MVGKTKRVFNIIDMFFDRKLDEWESQIPLEQRQRKIQDMEADELDDMLAASNDSARQFSLLTAMLAQAEVEVSELEGELAESVKLEKKTDGPKKEAVVEASERLAVSFTRAQARLAQLKLKIERAEELTEEGKAMIYDRAAEMRDDAFNDRFDLMEDNFNKVGKAMNNAVKRQIDVLNKSTDFDSKRAKMREGVVGDSAEIANEAEVLETLLNAQKAGRKAAKKAVDTGAAELLAKLRGESK